MSSIIVCIKRPDGLLLPCMPRTEPDGCCWTCPACGEVCCRVSFGVMNGFWRCRCEGMLEVMVDGALVDITHHILDQPPTAQAQPAPVMRDDEFLKGCGITVAEDEDKEYDEEEEEYDE